MHLNLLYVVACVAVGMSCGSAKAEQRIVCPPAVMSDQIKVQAPPGWAGAYLPDIKLKLDSAGARLGPLEQEGVLKGDVIQKSDTVEHKFSLTGGVADQLDKWMVCTYGDNVYLAQKLPSATKECTFTYRRETDSKANPPYAMSAISCK